MSRQLPLRKCLVFWVLIALGFIVSIPLLLGYTRQQYYETALCQSDGMVAQRTCLSRHEPEHLTNVNSTNITIYLEQISLLSQFYGNSYIYYEKIAPDHCLKAIGATCTFQHKSPNADVVFRQARMYHRHKMMPLPFRYCYNQIVAAFNTETEEEYFMGTMKDADIRIDYHVDSEITVTDACFGIPWNEDLYKAPNVTGRKGVALLMSNCEAKWRNDYIQEVMKYIHVYSYGKCFHNTDEPSSRENHAGTFPRIASKHRMVITFENTISMDYISEKIGLCYLSGVIPVYWGPPEIYQWVPGEHSFIDPQKFKGAKELAEYLKRVDEDDDLFRYHTTNFNYTLSNQTHVENCISMSMPCQLCEIAHGMKVKRIMKRINEGKSPIFTSVADYNKCIQ